MLFVTIFDLFLFSSIPLLALLHHLDFGLSVLVFALAGVYAPLVLLPLVFLLAFDISPFQIVVVFLEVATRQVVRQAGCISPHSVARLAYVCLREFVADRIDALITLASDPAVHAAACIAIDASILSVKVSHAFLVYVWEDIKACRQREPVVDVVFSGSFEEDHAAQMEPTQPTATSLDSVDISQIPQTEVKPEPVAAETEETFPDRASQASLEEFADVFNSWFAEETADLVLPSALSSSNSLVDSVIFSDDGALSEASSSPPTPTSVPVLNPEASVFTPKRRLPLAEAKPRLNPLTTMFAPGLPTPPVTPAVMKTRPVVKPPSTTAANDSESESESEVESEVFVIYSTPLPKRLYPLLAAFVPRTTVVAETSLNPQAAPFKPKVLPPSPSVPSGDRMLPSSNVTLNPFAKEFKSVPRSKPALTLDLGAIKARVENGFRGDLSPVFESSTRSPTTPEFPYIPSPLPSLKANYDAGFSAFLQPYMTITQSISFKDIRAVVRPEQTFSTSKTCFAIADLDSLSSALASTPLAELLPASLNADDDTLASAHITFVSLPALV